MIQETLRPLTGQGDNERLLGRLTAAGRLAMAAFLMIMGGCSNSEQSGYDYNETQLTAGPTAESITEPTEPTTETATEEVLIDPEGDPTWVKVWCDGSSEALVSAELATSTDQPGKVWTPKKDTAEWWSFHPKPGEYSEYPAIMAGHSTYKGKPDSFYRLKEVEPGCTVEVSYDSDSDGEPDQIVHFEIVDDPVFVNKAEATLADEYWTRPEPGRAMTMFTCDPDFAGVRPDRTAATNVVAKAVVTAVEQR